MDDIFSQQSKIGEAIKDACAEFQGSSNFQGVHFVQQDWDIICSIVSAAAEGMHKKYGVVMVPHHTQLITFIMFAIVTGDEQDQGSGSEGCAKTLLARVGTGEGKSLIIGMLAAFVAMKGLRAHVVIDNPTLVERDFGVMQACFDRLELTSAKTSAAGAKILQDKTLQIVYCTASDLRQCAVDSITDGTFGTHEENLADAVLVVDEIDGLLIDQEVTSCYVLPEDAVVEETDEWIAKYGSFKNTPRPADPNMANLHRDLKEAEAIMGSKTENIDYIITGNQHIQVVDKTTGLASPAYALWMELLSQKLFPGYKPRILIPQALMCFPRLLKAYRKLFGLTGSLGCEPEKKFLSSVYAATYINVPAFLDTCEGVTGKQGPQLIEEEKLVQENEDAQFSAIERLASSRCEYVPVLIVVKDRKQVQRLAKVLRRSVARLGEEYKQDNAVLELVPSATLGNQAFEKMVDRATAPLTDPHQDSNAGKPKLWRISVTTAEGARGQDYRVVDRDVDAAGGLFLIVSWVPWSEREYIQFLGRTARQDHPGQFAVVLNEKRAEIPQMLEGSSQEEIIEEMLKVGDKKIQGQLERASANVEKGAAMHEKTIEFFNVKKKIEPRGFWAWVNMTGTYHGMSGEAEIFSAFARDVYPGAARASIAPARASLASAGAGNNSDSGSEDITDVQCSDSDADQNQSN